MFARVIIAERYGKKWRVRTDREKEATVMDILFKDVIIETEGSGKLMIYLGSEREVLLIKYAKESAITREEPEVRTAIGDKWTLGEIRRRGYRILKVVG